MPTLTPSLSTSSSLTITVTHLVHHNPLTGFTVLKGRTAISPEHDGLSVISCVGTLPTKPERGDSLTCQGEWMTHPQYGQQFKITSLGSQDLLTSLTTPEGLSAWLASCGLPGVGPALATRMVNHFGFGIIDVLDSTPHQLLDIRGIGPNILNRIKEAWPTCRPNYLEASRLYSLGLTEAVVTKALHRFGKTAAQLLREDPYRLTELSQVGFHQADTLAKRLGIAHDSHSRIQAGFQHVLKQSERDGHCLLERSTLLQLSTGLLSLPIPRLDAALETCLQAHTLFAQDDNIYLKAYFEAERTTERHLLTLAAQRPLGLPLHPRTGTSDLILTSEQQHAVQQSLTAPLSIITGLPGTGKTTAVRGLVEQLKAAKRWVRLCAPTGKAAKRLQEKAGVSAMTIHRLLEFSPAEGGFRRNAKHPIEADTVIVDEASMIDIQLAEALTQAIHPSQTTLIFVGDANQLPSVGPGNFLNDLIASKHFPISTLTQIHRQVAHSSIIRLARDIHYNALKPRLTDYNADDLTVDLHQDLQTVQRNLVQLAKRLVTGGRYTNADIQVLAPTKTGLLGVQVLNELLQGALNPGVSRKVPHPFKRNEEGKPLEYRLGDRVIHTVNNYEKNVFNGEVGVIIDVDLNNQSLLVDFDDKHIEYTPADLEDLDLAYALTIHKSQGSEFPCVILAMHWHAYPMLKRELLYTGVTRAQRQLFLLGQRAAFRQAVNTTGHKDRKTGLFAKPIAPQVGPSPAMAVPAPPLPANGPATPSRPTRKLSWSRLLDEVAETHTNLVSSLQQGLLISQDELGVVIGFPKHSLVTLSRMQQAEPIRALSEVCSELVGRHIRVQVVELPETADPDSDTSPTSSEPVTKEGSDLLDQANAHPFIKPQVGGSIPLAGSNFSNHLEQTVPAPPSACAEIVLTGWRRSGISTPSRRLSG